MYYVTNRTYTKTFSRSSCTYLTSGRRRPHQTATKYDTQKCHTCIKAKMLAGIYWLGADEIKNKKGVPSTCPLCKVENEDLQHMVLRCSDNLHRRTNYIPLIQEGFLRIYTQEAWTHCSSSDYNLLKTIFDINVRLVTLSAVFIPSPGLSRVPYPMFFISFTCTPVGTQRGDAFGGRSFLNTFYTGLYCHFISTFYIFTAYVAV